MSYTKTTFVEGGAPGISAAELNKIGTGIEDAQDPAKILTAIKTVDGAGSDLDADKVKGKDATANPSPDTVVLRDAAGNISALGNMHVTNSGEAMYHLYNNGGVAEWKAGQRSGTDHHYKIAKVVAGVVTEYFILQSDGKLVVPGQATLQGSLVLSNAGDLTLQAAAGNASGDIIFRDSSGVEIGRVWVDQGSGKLSGRSGTTGAYTIWTNENFGGMNVVTLFAGGQTNSIVSTVDVDDLGSYFVPEAELAVGRTIYFEVIMKAASAGTITARLRKSDGTFVATSQISTTSNLWVRVRSGAVTGLDSAQSYRLYVNGNGEVGLARVLIK